MVSGRREGGSVVANIRIKQKQLSNSFMDHFRKVNANKLPMKGGGGVLTRKSQKSVYHDNQFLPTGYLADGL